MLNNLASEQMLWRLHCYCLLEHGSAAKTLNQRFTVKCSSQIQSAMLHRRCISHERGLLASSFVKNLRSEAFVAPRLSALLKELFEVRSMRLGFPIGGFVGTAVKNFNLLQPRLQKIDVFTQAFGQFLLPVLQFSRLSCLAFSQTA